MAKQDKITVLNQLNTGIEKGKLSAKDYLDGIKQVMNTDEQSDAYHCETCAHSEDYGESVEYIKCAASGKRKDVKKKQAACANYIPADDVIDTEPDGDLEDQLDELLKKEPTKRKPRSRVGGACEEMREDCAGYKKGEKQIKGADESCQTEEYPTNTGSNSCASGTVETAAISSVGKPTVMTAGDSRESKEEVKKLSHKEEMQKLLDEAAPNATCKHFKGFTYVGIASQNPAICCDCRQYPLGYGGEQFMIERPFKNYCCEGNKCEVGGTYEVNAPENTAINITEPDNIVAFDYSTVDEETAGFLQEKANKITEIRIKSVLALGKELKEAQEKLANHGNGTFEKWVSSLNMSDQTARNYINGFEWIGKNFANLEDAKEIQPSLLFAASKSSAPAELQQAVVDGDITKHKDYVEALKKLELANIEKEAARKSLYNYIDLEKRLTAENKLLQGKTQNMQELVNQQVDATRKIFTLEQQLDQAKKNGDPSKVKELGEKVSGYQCEIETLKRQLHDKPIEISATRVIEKVVVPDEVAVAIYNKISSLYEGLAQLTEVEIQIFSKQVDPHFQNSIHEDIKDAVSVLDRINAAVGDVR